MQGFKRWLGLALISGLIFSGAYAQESDGAGLIVESYELIARVDDFGLDQTYVDGWLSNADSVSAYADLSLYAEVYDANDEIIGEGVGFAVNICRTGLLPDFTLQPAHRVRFSIRLELDTEPGDIARVDIFANGLAVESAPMNPFLTYNDLVSVTDGDVVSVEWIDADNLRYGVGCYRDAFTALTWYEYNLSGGTITPLDEHPNAVHITETFLERTELTDPVIYNRGFVSFHPQDSRMVYQDAINTLMTIERDGTFKRLLYNDLSRVSLQGFVWLPEGRFLAYYFGAYGEPVRYITASMAGQTISRNVYTTVPSLIIPGANMDGSRVIIATEIDGVTGYYLHSTTTTLAQLLFEAEPPGNNYPAPIYREGTAGRTMLYIIRPLEDGQVRLQCYDSNLQRAVNMAVLPLKLTTDDRAWSSISPDNRMLAIHADGQDGGLWLYDLEQSSACRE